MSESKARYLNSLVGPRSLQFQLDPTTFISIHSDEGLNLEMNKITERRAKSQASLFGTFFTVANLPY